MHPQDAIKEMSPPPKSFAFILPPFKGTAQKGTTWASPKDQFFYGTVWDEKVFASHLPGISATFSLASLCGNVYSTSNSYTWTYG